MLLFDLRKGAVDQREVGALFSLYDADNSGALDFREFCEVLPAELPNTSTPPSLP